MVVATIQIADRSPVQYRNSYVVEANGYFICSREEFYQKYVFPSFTGENGEYTKEEGRLWYKHFATIIMLHRLYFRNDLKPIKTRPEMYRWLGDNHLCENIAVPVDSTTFEKVPVIERLDIHWYDRNGVKYDVDVDIIWNNQES